MSLRSRRLWLVVACAAAAAVAVAPGLAQSPSDAERGRALFAEKQCNRCHVAGGGSGVGPGLEELRRPQGSLELVGRLWNHVPAMWATLTQEGSRWPELTAAQMGDLMAFLNADTGRDPAPDASKGHVVLMRKGCLKCHSLRREGGRVPPDLSAWRRDYESPAAWASTMWTHTPRMVREINRQNVPYPRFARDEMVNLLGFLRQTSAPAPGK
jgi:cytochrome c2